MQSIFSFIYTSNAISYTSDNQIHSLRPSTLYPPKFSHMAIWEGQTIPYDTLTRPHSLTLQGRGSSWQDSLVLSASGNPISGAGGGGGGAGAGGVSGPEPGGLLNMEPSEVARVFEEKLSEALLGESSNPACLLGISKSTVRHWILFLFPTNLTLFILSSHTSCSI